LREALAHGSRSSAGLVGKIGIDAGRGRRNRPIEDIVEQPFAAEDGRSAVGIRSGREQRTLREQAAALIVIRKGYAAEATAVDAGDSVMPGQALIDERVIRIQQI